MTTAAAEAALAWLQSNGIRPKDGHEAIALAAHALLLHHGFRPAELPADEDNTRNNIPNTLPNDWGGAGYGGRYRHNRSAMTFDIRAMPMGGRLVLHAAAHEDDARMHTVDVRVEEYINNNELPNGNDDNEESTNNINWSNIYTRLDDLATLIAVQVAHRLVPDSTKEGYEDATREEQEQERNQVNNGGGGGGSSSNNNNNQRPYVGRMIRPRYEDEERNDPLRIGGPRRPIYPGGLRPDGGFGSDDLLPGGLRPFPFGGGGGGGFGGGNLMGPGQLPRRGGVGGNGGWRPSNIPPGVRYDPIYPNPDNDAELPPGFEDEHEIGNNQRSQGTYGNRRPSPDDDGPPPPGMYF